MGKDGTAVDFSWTSDARIGPMEGSKTSEESLRRAKQDDRLVETPPIPVSESKECILDKLFGDLHTEASLPGPKPGESRGFQKQYQAPQMPLPRYPNPSTANLAAAHIYTPPTQQATGDVRCAAQPPKGGREGNIRPTDSCQDVGLAELDDLTCCPITQDVMTDPVLACDGNTYERSAIEQWFEGKGAAISPLTMEPLASAQLTPNLAIQQMLSLRASMAEGMHG